MAHRFFLPPTALRENRVIFPDAQAHQIRSVLRLLPGEDVIILDNQGSEYAVNMEHITRDRVEGIITEKRAARGEPQTQIVLYQGLLKADKFEWVLQKCTEVGVAEFVPMVTARAIADNVSAARKARWERIVVEAAEQAGRGKIPLLHLHQPFADGLSSASRRGGLVLIPYEAERTRDLAVALALTNHNLIHLFIGPEGGFTSEEVVKAEEHGAVSVTLGPRILRAETAGLVAATAILYARGDLSAA